MYNWDCCQIRSFCLIYNFLLHYSSFDCGGFYLIAVALAFKVVYIQLFERRKSTLELIKSHEMATVLLNCEKKILKLWEKKKCCVLPFDEPSSCHPNPVVYLWFKLNFTFLMNVTWILFFIYFYFSYYFLHEILPTLCCCQHFLLFYVKILDSQFIECWIHHTLMLIVSIRYSAPKIIISLFNANSNAKHLLYT